MIRLQKRQKPENAAFDYPDHRQTDLAQLKKYPQAIQDWYEYIKFNMNLDWQTAEILMEQIPSMAVTGIIGREEIVAAYKKILHGTGCRVSKKAEGLIDALCTTMPLATKKGNMGISKSTVHTVVTT